MINPTGLCECGCGKLTAISKYNNPQYGWIKGKSRRFIQHHCQIFVSEATKEEIKRLYNIPLSISAIASKTGITKESIKKILLKAGIDLKDRYFWISQRMKKTTGTKHFNWKGGKYKSEGYIHVKSDRCKSGYIGEHILVWEKTYNKRLPKGWLVHHLNGIRDDNRPENLIGMKIGEHSQLAKPYIKRIKELEEEIRLLKQDNLFRNN